MDVDICSTDSFKQLQESIQEVCKILSEVIRYLVTIVKQILTDINIISYTLNNNIANTLVISNTFTPRPPPEVTWNNKIELYYIINMPILINYLFRLGRDTIVLAIITYIFNFFDLL